MSLLSFFEDLTGTTPQPGDNEHLRRFLNDGGTIEEYMQIYAKNR